MYKRKLFYFGLTTAFILLVALTCTAISAHLTRENLKQSTIAQSLLIEHQQLSSISYRLFKQLTDEVIFGQNANQANVRKKQKLIEQSLTDFALNGAANINVPVTAKAKIFFLFNIFAFFIVIPV